MTAPHPHLNSEAHRGLVPTDQLGAAPGTAGYVLTDTGTGTGIFLPGTAVPPGSWSRLTARSGVADITGIADGGDAAVVLDTIDDLVGTDIEVDGGDNTRINILVDGIYAVALRVSAHLDTPADAISAFATLDGLDALAPGALFQPAVSGDVIATVSFTGFLAAGTQFGSIVTMTGSTWTLYAGSRIVVQRLA